MGLCLSPKLPPEDSQITQHQRVLLVRHKIDTDILQEVHGHCQLHSDDIPITERCSYTFRLCTALRYFEVIKSSEMDENEKMRLFVEFNEKIYRYILDDTTHFIENHENDIIQVHKEWTEMYGLPKCSIKNCAPTARHYGRGRGGDNTATPRTRSQRWSRARRSIIDDQDTMYSFYESLYDRVHHYVFHLFEVGLRVDTSSLHLDLSEDDDEIMDSEGVTMDRRFAAERDWVKLQKQRNLDSTTRFVDIKNKFTIQTTKEKDGITLMDVVFQKLSESNDLERRALNRTKAFLSDNLFDSDCIEDDIQKVPDSNVYRMLRNDNAVKQIAEFMRSINCMFPSKVS